MGKEDEARTMKVDSRSLMLLCCSDLLLFAFASDLKKSEFNVASTRRSCQEVQEMPNLHACRRTDKSVAGSFEETDLGHDCAGRRRRKSGSVSRRLEQVTRHGRLSRALQWLRSKGARIRSCRRIAFGACISLSRQCTCLC